MICDQTVKEVDIVFADGAEVEEFIYGSLLEGQLRETYIQVRSASRLQDVLCCVDIHRVF